MSGHGQEKVVCTEATKKARGVVIPLSVAPMMDRSDRHYRFLMRQISRRTLIYTEMITTSAIEYGDKAHLLGYSPEEHPVALQLGGEDPAALRRCARIAEDLGYDEVNLNVGCPSGRVQNARFGACLMNNPERVAEAVSAMRDEVGIPVTVKHRIGVDERDKYEHMAEFVSVVAQAGCDRFTVHARKAWLTGLNPKQNRTVPPLRYDDVYKLKNEFPHLAIEINGGILTLDQVAEQLDHVDAVMIGRAAYDDPYIFAEADRRFLGSNEPAPTRRSVVEAMLPYVERHLEHGGKLIQVARHMLNLFNGQPGARRWRRFLSTQCAREGGSARTLAEALKLVE